ncbi:MAG: hypothetical protein HBSAPP03_19360 [Phycisphaerae bacterium]|nr:MAG: hypothetical protein HBSAPP03_19360 [Phycisphaerae bacterium]
MTLLRIISLIGVGTLVLVANVAASILYMVVYGHLINPGHPKPFYDEHVKVAAPYCSIVAGIPLMFLAGLWVAGWGGPQAQLGVKAALTVWLAYVVIDLGIIAVVGGVTTRLCWLIAISALTKLAAVYAGAHVRAS